MLLHREGLLQEGELVLCTVTNIQYNSVFARLDEYGRQGMIHISEISPGRIRNIRDFVVDGKVIVCKVLNVNVERGYIDLSLRRVTQMQHRQKIDEIKQEQKAEKIIEGVAHQLKKPIQEIYKIIANPVLKKYPYVYLAFDDVVKNNSDLKEFGIGKEISEPLIKAIKEKIKIKEVSIGGALSLSSYEENGLELVKKALIDAEKTSDKISIKYLGAGKYKVEVTAKEYKEAEKILKTAVDTAINFIKKNKGTGEFVRQETN